ncbi:MAG: type II toxin-antitoxin system prevent-host-death family antitoxin [Propionibacterium sp.]|nr:type II toxin-antitoxin system prevent-host-death family antitoxin [Propionibacterium sp.]
MARELTLRELRQNPTSAIDAVEDGEVVVITRRNRPVADLVPHRRRRGATPDEFAALLARTTVDDGWAEELAHQRSGESRDHWGDDA